MLKIEKTIEELKSFCDNWHCEPDYYGLLSIETKANELLDDIKTYKLKALERCLKEIKATIQENTLNDSDQINLIIDALRENGFINENI